LDELEEAGIIGPSQGAKPREILVTANEVQNTMKAGGELNAFDEVEEEIDDEEEEEEEYEDEENDEEEESDEEEEEYEDEEDDESEEEEEEKLI